MNKIDVRVGKIFTFGARTLETTVDFDNLTNAATVWQVRNRTEAASFLDPSDRPARRRCRSSCRRRRSSGRGRSCCARHSGSEQSVGR